MNKTIREISAVTVAILLAIKSSQLWLPANWLSAVVPALLLYIPIAILWRVRRPIDFLDCSWKQTLNGFSVFLVSALIIFPPYFFLADGWMIRFFGYGKFSPAPWQAFTQNIWYQLFVVALPEEFYFRGYMQGALKKVFSPRWKIFGVPLGWGWLLTALTFAFAHSVVALKWWHFSIFFPALLFGYLREKTGSITAPLLFHAFSNCFMNWFAKSYF